MNKRKLISLILLSGTILVLVIVGRRHFSSSASGGVGVGGEVTPEPQNVKVFAVEKSSFTDSIDGLVGTVKGDTIELSYFGQEEPLTAIHVKVGDRVKKGDLLFELDHLRAQARKELAEVAYERGRQMHKAGASTAMDLKETKSAFDIAQRDYEDTFIRAPKDGYVSEISRQVGETVGRDKPEPLGVLVSSQDKLFLETGVIEGHLERVKKGQAVLVDIDSFGLVGVRGSVAGVSREVTTTGRTGTVLVGLPSAVQSKLRPGLSARCRILTFDGEALLIPRQAYAKEQGAVYVVRDGKALLTRVVLGYVAPDYYEVQEGLAPGDEIVADLIINPVENNAPVAITGPPEHYTPPTSPS
jgi:membrane fusion protein (multidrug efflux system)